MDVDASKLYGFDCLVYHVKGELDSVSEGSKCLQFRSQDVDPIMLLSKLLTAAESKYWPTELEMADLVWVVRTTRHLEESAPKTFVFTGHAAAGSILNKFNLRRRKRTRQPSSKSPSPSETV